MNDGPELQDERPHSVWETLSKAWLTKGALKELDRRDWTLQQARHAYTRPSRRLEGLEALWEAASREDELRKFAMQGSQKMHLYQVNLRRPPPVPVSTASFPLCGEHFDQALLYSGVRCLPDSGGGRDRRPANYRDILEMITEPERPVLPARARRARFERFRRLHDATLSGHATEMEQVVPMAFGPAVVGKEMAEDVVFDNMADVAGRGFALARPDFYFGERPETLSAAVRDELFDVLVPSTMVTMTTTTTTTTTTMPAAGRALPIVPNFFFQTKLPAGEEQQQQQQQQQRTQQLHYCGALGARAMQALVNYSRPGEEEEPVYDRKARCLTATYQAGTLAVYAHWIVRRRRSKRLEYRTRQVAGWTMPDDEAQMTLGMDAFRNVEAWTGDMRLAAIELANSRARGREGSEA